MLYAVGDIHGRLDLVTKLYQAIQEDIEKVKDPNGVEIIFVGDYVDRGPDSKGVLDFLIGLRDTDMLKHVFLLGNHEDLMFKSVLYNDHNSYSCWMGNGGQQTCKSFGFNGSYYVGEWQDALRPYAEWMRKLPFFYEKYNYIFCHSGFLRIDFNIDLKAQREALIWGRPHQGQYIGFDKWVIHGHTPCMGEPDIDVNRINMDVGAVFCNTLAAVVLPHGPCMTDDPRYLQIWG
jgi:serine/threonine protein phosphatase 1